MSRLRNFMALESTLIEDFSQKYRIPPFASQVFLRRAITQPQEVKFFIEDDLRFMHNPFLFVDMENVVERINQAITEGEKIMVFGDRDVDGITSATILTRYIRSRGGDVTARLPINDDPYGLSEKAVREFSENEGTLIITVDCGITNLTEIQLAMELGIDTIIIDHHNIPEIVPPAVAIIDPKDDESGYPFKGLSAAALTAKVVWALEFSQAEYFNQDFCLIHASPANDSLFFDAMIIRNFVPIKRIRETIVLGSHGPVKDRILRFIEHYPLFWFEADVQKKFMHKIFGSIEIAAHDLSVDLFNQHPSLQGKSLTRIVSQSKTARYQPETPLEIDGLFQVFQVVFAKQLTHSDTVFKNFLPYVSLSLVADMMPMRDENRVLMKQGLQQINQALTSDIGLHNLLLELDLRQKKIQVKDIGWRIAPLLNSSGRMGRPDIALELLLSSDQSRCHACISQLTEFNTTRKKLGEDAWKRLQSRVQEIKTAYDNKIILVVDEIIPRGITGILAGRISREYDITAIVIAKLEDRYIGSIRTAHGLSATWLLDACAYVLKDFGGHDAAGGFYMDLGDIENFKTAVKNTLSEWELPTEIVKKTNADIVLEAKELDDSIWEMQKIFIPYGQEFSQVLTLLKNVQIQSMQTLGKDSRHLSIELNAEGRVWSSILWEGSIPLPFDFKTGDTIDCLVSFDKNHWRTTITPQLILHDIERLK